MIKIKPVQVRRDLMLIGCSSTSRNEGYSIIDLINKINNVIYTNKPVNTIFIGIENYAVIPDDICFDENKFLKIISLFDCNPSIVESHKKDCDLPCYHIGKLPEIISKYNIELGIIATKADFVENIAEILIMSRIKGILNISPVQLKVPENIYLKEMNIVTSLDSLSYFTRQITEKR